MILKSTLIPSLITALAAMQAVSAYPYDVYDGQDGHKAMANSTTAKPTKPAGSPTTDPKINISSLESEILSQILSDFSGITDISISIPAALPTTNPEDDKDWAWNEPKDSKGPSAHANNTKGPTPSPSQMKPSPIRYPNDGDIRGPTPSPSQKKLSPIDYANDTGKNGTTKRTTKRTSNPSTMKPSPTAKSNDEDTKGSTPTTKGGKGPNRPSPTVASPKVFPSPVKNSLQGDIKGNGSIPANVQALYNKIRSTSSCSSHSELKAGFSAQVDSGANNFCYCDEFIEGKGIYIRGTGTDLAPMKVDCDGNQKGISSRCGSSKDIQSQTAFQPQVAAFGIPDLRADIHPYVVLGNQGKRQGYINFDPQSHGVEPLSVVAVVCNSKVVFGIWGDTNGDDDRRAVVGETSLALATACFGESVNGNSGHDQNDILYIAFSGKEAVPGNAANWKASNYEEFEQSISDLGNKLLATL